MDTDSVSNAPLVFICSDSFPSKSLFWLAKSTITNLTISPMYMPLIIFSNLKHRGKKRRYISDTVTEIDKNVIVLFLSSDTLTVVVLGSTRPHRSPDRISCELHLIFHRPRTRPTRSSRPHAVLIGRRRRVRRFPPFQHNTRCSPFLHKQTCYKQS